MQPFRLLMHISIEIEIFITKNILMKSIVYSLLFILPTFALSQMTVVDVIVNSPDYNTLEAAVIAAGLAQTLSGDGPFTVFAPTDAAFDALPNGTVDALLEIGYKYKNDMTAIFNENDFSTSLLRHQINLTSLFRF